MGRALVLNVTHEPLSIVSTRRAVVLVLDDKADVLHDTGEVLHAERLQVAIPSVIRLRRFVKVPFRRRAPLTRRAVFLRDGHACQYCGARAESIDHVIPRSRGGCHSWENVVACCRRCNAGKRDRLLADTTMRLDREPAAPRHLSWVAVTVGHVPDAWAPYVEGPAPLVAASA